MTRSVWIGLVAVNPRPGSKILGKVDAAFSNALALAKNRRDFVMQVRKALESWGLSLTKVEDPEPLAERTSKWTVHKSLLRLAKETHKTGAVRFGTFFTYSARRRSVVTKKRKRPDSPGR